LEMARNRFAQGIATQIDVLRSEVNLSNLDPERIRAENQVRLATAALANLIMIGMDVPIRVEGKLERRPWSPGPLSELEAHALEVRPDLVVARRQLDEARLLLSLARAENKLSVDLESRFGYSVRNPENIMRYDFARWNLTVNFRLPFYDSGRKAGLVTQAIARVRVAEHNLAQLENAVRLEIKTAHSDLLSADESFSAAGLNILQAEKVLVMMQANYQYGAATTLDVVDSQTALTLARNSQISAAYGYEVAKAGLRLAAGMPILGEEERP
ncbi:MAG: TolC family protein, partial [Acidobacteriota bacterium]